ncbi:DNA polymerase beta superfamily protein [Paenibacillus methanolicus]|uniref:Putative nucleotidyltransferase n=1 Tax=Paenibacillus methanolicus TaxID=582686 RepID=A0A5S5CJN1_9BACL|nr:nucleotidyltransferase domain-containing protein [Paenibacillus methanolicus]TYP79223.1 putative nucleotidyltransferase [Paenibacillus methanolicus]
MVTFNHMTAEELQQYFEPQTILRTITGSTSYGLNTATSDVDEKSVVILPKRDCFDLSQEFETVVAHEPDHEYHALKKFMNLANTQNPTVLEILFTEDRFVTKIMKHGEELRKHRELFLSSACFDSFGGYARQQLMRIKSGLGRATIEDNLTYLTETLERIIRTFDLHYPGYKDGVFAIRGVNVDDDGKAAIGLTVHYDGLELKQLAGMTAELTNASKNFNKMGARNKRPDEKLEKHAMHLIRLLKMAIEVLTTGKLNVYREKDRDELLSIRQGKYTWDEIFEMVAGLETRLREAKAATVLPAATDSRKIGELYSDLMIDWYG